MSYYLKFQGKTQGPYSIDILRTLQKDGLLSDAHRVSTDGVTWCSVRALPELQSALAGEPSTTAAPPVPPTDDDWFKSPTVCRGCGLVTLIVGLFVLLLILDDARFSLWHCYMVIAFLIVPGVYGLATGKIHPKW